MSERYDPALFAGASIAFDLDGTLVDTAPDLVRTLNTLMTPRGIDHVPLSDIRSMVGRGAKAMIVRAHERAGRSVADDELDELFVRFVEIYESDVAGASEVFPGVADVLGELKSAGADLSVCTNKPSGLADQVVEALDLAPYFSRVIGPERTRAKKPAADHVIDALGGEFPRSALVGDSRPDVESARAAGVPSIVLSYGYSESPADSLGADRVIHAFRDVPGALAEIWRARGL